MRDQPLERPLDNVNLNINVLISTPDERPALFKCRFSGEKRGSTVLRNIYAFEYMLLLFLTAASLPPSPADSGVSDLDIGSEDSRNRLQGKKSLLHCVG